MRKNRIGMLLLTAFLVLAAVPASVKAEETPENAAVPSQDTETVPDGWDETGTHYYVDGNMLKKTLRKIDGAYYYFGKDSGVVKDRFMKVSGSYYYFGEDGKASVKELKVIKGKKYYFGKNGAALTNQFKKIRDGKKKYTFYFGKKGAAFTAPEDKYSVTIKAFKINKKYYGFDEDAHMVTGLWVVNGSTKDTVYYFNKKGVNNNGVSKRLTKIGKIDRRSKNMYKEVLKYFGKPGRIRESDGCYAFDGGEEKEYKDYNFIYDNVEVSISQYTRTGVYRMNGVYTFNE